MIGAQVGDRVADTAAATSGGAILFGMTIAQINQYLQAGAFIVAIVSGSCAAWYYIRKGRSKD